MRQLNNNELMEVSGGEWDAASDYVFNSMGSHIQMVCFDNNNGNVTIVFDTWLNDGITGNSTQAWSGSDSNGNWIPDYLESRINYMGLYGFYWDSY
ncbi:MAG: hypothetical protein JXB00_20365 [Bacteroidales bacterium]|nr:hypothetical protein [Bacteroidales bacterium]